MARVRRDPEWPKWRKYKQPKSHNGPQARPTIQPHGQMVSPSAIRVGDVVAAGAPTSRSPRTLTRVGRIVHTKNVFRFEAEDNAGAFVVYGGAKVYRAMKAQDRRGRI